MRYGIIDLRTRQEEIAPPTKQVVNVTKIVESSLEVKR